MKAKLIGVFNGLIWSFIMYIIFALFASLVSWSNCFDITSWDSGGRGIFLIIAIMILGACIPFKGVK